MLSLTSALFSSTQPGSESEHLEVQAAHKASSKIHAQVSANKGVHNLFQQTSSDTENSAYLDTLSDLQRCDNEECIASLETRPYLKMRKVRKVRKLGQLWQISEIFCIYYS